MDIRKVKIEDYNQVIELYAQLDDAERIFDSNLIDTHEVPEEQKKKIEKRIKSRKGIFLVAVEDENIVGLIDGYIIDSIYYKEKVGYLDHVCVDKKHRNKGIGTKLIEEFTKKMKTKNVAYLKLNAFENNTPAVNLYKKLGFEEYSIYYMKKI